MTELLLLVILACGQPVFVVMQPIGKDMKVYSEESMGKARWTAFLKIVEGSMEDPTVARLELPVEQQAKIVCVQSTSSSP